jgi:hypothetical protein
MPSKIKIAIGVLVITGIVVAMATMPSVLPNHIRIAVRTEQGETRYSINEKTLNQQQLLSIVRKIGGFSKGPFDINVDQTTSFVEVARLVEAIKKEAPESQYFLTYMDSTNRIKVLYDARVMPELMTEVISIYEIKRWSDEVESSTPQSPHSELPEVLHITIGGFDGPSYDLLLTNGTLQYKAAGSISQLEDMKAAIIAPTASQWTAFRSSLDEIGVWNWKTNYINPDVLDGMGWSINVKYHDTGIFAEGANAYPESDGIDPSPIFQKLTAAVSMLLSGRDFK